MMFDTRAFRLLVAFLIVACVVYADHYTLDFDCEPSGDIVITNPDISTLKSATAGTNTSICNVTKAADLSTFTVSGCNKSDDIEFTLSTRSEEEATGDGIIGGSYSETYIIKCEEIPEEGIIFNSSLGIEVVVKVVEHENDTFTNMSTHAVAYTQPPVTPSFAITSSIWNTGLSQTVTNADIGDQLKWKIQGPVEYDLLPYTCKVNPGTILGAPPVVTVIQNGCSVMDMVTNFVNNTASGYVISDLYAFKFTISNDLTFSCSVRVCTRGDAACTVDCDRKRRSVQEDDKKILAGTRAIVFSHLTIGDSGALTLGLSYLLLISACSIALYQSRSSLLI